MKYLKKAILAVFILLILLFCSAGIFITLRRDRIATVIVEKLNNSVNTKISFSSLSVNLWSDFPNISATLNNFLIKPSAEYAKEEFVKENSDTLLYASHFSVSLNLIPLLSGKIEIKGISIKNGNACFLTDSRGNTNFTVFKDDGANGNQSEIRLSDISARNMRILYADHATDLLVKGKIENSSLSGEILGTGIELSAGVSAMIDRLDFYGFRFSNSKAVADLTFFKSKSSYTFREGNLKLGDLLFSIKGSTDYQNKWIDLDLTGKNIDISDITSVLPAEYASYLSGIRPGGIMSVSCRIKGPYGSKGDPHFDIDYNLAKGRLVYDQSGIDVNNLSMRGRITNGTKNNRKTFSFKIDTLNAAFGAAYFNGSFSLVNAESPFIRMSVNGDLVFNDLRKLITTKSFESREGAISGNLKLKGFLPEGKKFSLSDISKLNPNGNLRIQDFAADLPDMGVSFNNVSGKIRLSDELRVEDLCMTILGQKYCFNCVLSNFTDWVTGGASTLDVTGDVTSDIFIPSAFAETQKKNSGSKAKSGEITIFPKKVTAYINFHADSVINKDFHAGNFNATLSYKPYVVSFNNLTARCLDGSVNGDMLIGLKSDGNYIVRGTFDLNSINIRKSFDSFHNFGQSFIVGKNLDGTITGNVSVLYQMDRNFNINYQSLVGESHASVVNGRLIDFKPAEALSSFVELEELKNISFSKLENDFFVRNSALTLPRMEITSSVGWFSVFGTHNFSGDYSYHIRVLLSEVLSKKAKTRNRNNTEFGQVVDYEGNKTTIPLKMESKGGRFSVGYDFGQSKEMVKENIVEEKKNLKGILNEEYGWYKGDSTKTRTEKTVKPKFKINWEEGKDQDSQNEKTDSADNTSLRNLFKKKK